MKVDVLKDFHSLKDEWNLLLNRSLVNNVFMTWEWLSTWWKHFGEGREPLILVIQDRDEILAIAPLMVSKYKIPCFGTLKKIEFVGIPDSDYHGFIVLKREKDCLKLILNFLKDNVLEWDWIELKEIPEASIYPEILRKLPSEILNDLKLKERVCSVCPYIEIPDSIDLLMKNLRKKMRVNVSRYMKKLKKKYNVKFERYDEIGPVQRAMETFIALHQKRWKSKNVLGVFGGEKGKKFADFHMNIAKTFAKKGWLGLYFLTANDAPISTQYTFEYGEKMYGYLAGLDTEYYSYSVGNLIIRFLLEECIRKGLKEYDMMRGNESYKNSWATNKRENLEIRFDRRGALRSLYNWVRERIHGYSQI